MSSLAGTNLSISGNAAIGTSSSNHQIVGSVVLYNPLSLNNTTITQTGNSGTNLISQPTTFSSAVTLNGGITNSLTFNGLVNSGSTSFYSVLNVLSSSLTNANCINFNNGTNSYSVQQIDSSGSNYLRIGRTGNSDVTINSDGTTSFNNSIFLPIVNGAYSLYFGYYLNQIGRCFANSNQMFFDFYSAFTFRYLSAKDGSTGLNSIFSITSGGISTPSTVTSNAISTNFITCNTIGFNYLSIPSYYSSNYMLIGSQQIFYPTTNNISIVSCSPSFTMPITNIMILTIGQTNSSTQLINGIYNLKWDLIFWSANTSNTISMQWIDYGISTTLSSGTIVNNDYFNNYAQETRTIPTNSSLGLGLGFAVKYTVNLTINTLDFPLNQIFFNVAAQYTGGTNLQVINTGSQTATKVTFTRIG